jgi:hypothetical protein
LLSCHHTCEDNRVALLVTGDFRSLHNEIDYLPGMGSRGSVAGGNLTGGSTHSLRHEPLGIWMNNLIIF